MTTDDENARLRTELEEARGEPVPARFRLTDPPTLRPKPRLSLEEAREQAARAAAMWHAPDRPEDPDA